ncbi:DUF262 domain-containing protein [Sulfuriferula nivalis]|uniref:GmrSD restriction endonucleases N-terminal domain-containing protein n=1 Tax=Sulfuriferula nivalis TaxID=2675298 RepID=A0A809S9N4_9PROT|nr:DUF262 domain-containing protein [Sulfuriferula nivalis]BBP01052.1 hypothetical protein SFSGTM_17600 [Sulfuriferula nivalis]
MTDIKLDCDDWPFCNGAQVIGMKLPEYLAWASNTGTYAKQLLLPSIQRGFVWKPKQIVDLWDSLLRGMPIGSLMVSKLAAGESATNIVEDKRVSAEVQSESVGLLDGQQRTLSMLLGWFEKHSKQHCLWIDLGRDGGAGATFELRITTKAQPFGFQRISQTRLSRHERKEARKDYDKNHQQHEERRDYELFNLDKTEQPRPYVAGRNSKLFIRLTDAWNVFRGLSDKKAFMQKLFGDTDEEKVKHKLEQLYDAFERIASLEVPLILIPEYISQSQPEAKDNKNNEFTAPLILLFERIGSNATKLTPDDLLFSMIKQQWPEAHNLVEKVKSDDFPYPMSSSDYVMTAYRLAAAQTEVIVIGDNPRPKPSDFHRHLATLLGTKEKPGPLRNYLMKDSQFVNAFKSLGRTLIYRGEKDSGIPNYMLPHLSRGLIQVLLRWIMLNDEKTIADSRETIIAFALFWYLHIWNDDGASKKAFEIAGVEGAFPAEAIYNALIKSNSGNENEIGLALPLMPPDELNQILLPYESTRLLTADKLFKDDHNTIPQRELYKRFCWWRKPILLWLQRDYVEKAFSKLTSDSNLIDEDTVPYDYDHLCPQDHWGKHWSYIKCSDSDFHAARNDIGNCIGNLHVLESSLNRSFGDDPLASKLETNLVDWQADDSKLYENQDHEQLWLEASPKYGDVGSKECWVWHEKRLQAFQHAVYRRAFNLYSEYYAVCSSILSKDAGSNELTGSIHDLRAH